MPRVTAIVTSFAGGELSPYMYGRTDINRYYSSCRRLENFIPLPQGAAERRGGTRFVAAAKHDGGRVRLISFEFSDQQSYAIEAGAGYLRFYKDKAPIMAGAEAYEVAAPWQESDLDGIRWCQSADVVFLVHPRVRPQMLSRRAHTDWTLAPVEFVDGPYLEENTSPATLHPSSTTGTITITASSAAPLNGGAGFLPTDIGRLVRIGHIAAAWVANTNYSAGDIVRNRGAVYKCIGAGTSASSGGPSTTDTLISDGGVMWQYLAVGGLQWGCATITGVTTALTVQAAVSIPFVLAEPVATWRLGLWSDTTGWPSAVTFHEERLVFGSATTNRPQRIDASKTGDFTAFGPGTADGDPLAFSIGSNKVNKIRWLASMRALLVGTMGAEFVVSAEQGAPLTPSNLSARPHSRNGCASVAPIEVGNAVIYVQRQGRKLCELTYRFADDAYGSTNLTLLADHVAATGLAEIAWQQEPHGIAWGARVDGQLVGCTYLPEQEVTAWHRHPLGGGGAVESLCVISGAEGSDELWLVVRRVVNGAVRRYIEVLEGPLPLTGRQKDAFYVDSGLSYAGAPVARLTGLDHLEGQAVAILADGSTHPSRVVQAGAIDLDWAASTVHAGLCYRSLLQTMELDAGQGEGTAQGKTKRIGRITLRLLRSLGGFVGRDESHLEPLLQSRHADTPMGEAPPLFTGDESVPFPGDWGADGSVMLIQDAPLPFTINAIMPRVVTSDG